jgi:hypothetical protein
MFHGQTSFSSGRLLPASTKSRHSSPPSTPTVSLVSSLPNCQITRPCKRPNRSRWCSAPCNWPSKPYTTNSKPLTGYPCPSLHTRTRVLLTVQAKCEMVPKIAYIKVFLAPIPFNSSKLSRIGEILLANVAGVLQPLMCPCLGCEVAATSFFSFWKQWAILPTVLCICGLAPFGDVVMCFRILGTFLLM